MYSFLISLIFIISAGAKMPLPEDLQILKSRVNRLSNAMNKESCYSGDVADAFLSASNSIKELEQIFSSIIPGKDNTAQHAQISMLKEKLKKNMDVIENKHQDCNNIDSTSSQGIGSTSFHTSNSLNTVRPNCSDEIQYNQPPHEVTSSSVHGNNSELDPHNSLN